MFHRIFKVRNISGNPHKRPCRGFGTNHEAASYSCLTIVNRDDGSNNGRLKCAMQSVRSRYPHELN